MGKYSDKSLKVSRKYLLHAKFEVAERIWFYLIPTAQGRVKWLRKHKKLAMLGEHVHWQPRKYPTDGNMLKVHDNVAIASNVEFTMHDIIHWIFDGMEGHLVNGGKSCMAGFVLKNTLSDNGGVTRGICKMDENGNLTEVVETKNIVKTADGAEADGVVVDVNSLVSMNMWGLTPDFLDVLENGFKEFFEKEVPSNPQKAEYLIPIFIGELLEQGKMSVKVLKTNDTWYGMTYHEDVAVVKDSFKKMLETGVYKADLFADL